MGEEHVFQPTPEARDEATRLAYKDANNVDIQTTSEGKSFLRSRYKYWLAKLSPFPQKK